MELHRVVLRGLVAVPLVGHHVDDRHRPRGSARLPERLLELLEVVSVDRADVLKPISDQNMVGTITPETPSPKR